MFHRIKILTLKHFIFLFTFKNLFLKSYFTCVETFLPWVEQFYLQGRNLSKAILNICIAYNKQKEKEVH